MLLLIPSLFLKMISILYNLKITHFFIEIYPFRVQDTFLNPFSLPPSPYLSLSLSSSSSLSVSFFLSLSSSFHHHLLLFLFSPPWVRLENIHVFLLCRKSMCTLQKTRPVIILRFGGINGIVSTDTISFSYWETSCQISQPIGISHNEAELGTAPSVYTACFIQSTHLFISLLREGWNAKENFVGTTSMDLA